MPANHRGVARGCVGCRPHQAALASRDGVGFLDLGGSNFSGGLGDSGVQGQS